MVQGNVLDGRVVVDGDLPEGARVTVVIEEDAPVELSPEDEAELAERLAAAERGESVEYSRLPDVRRLHLSRIHYYPYYQARDNDILVLALWHTRRDAMPTL